MVCSVIYNQIPVMSAVGSGGTPLAAFHAALATIGLDRFNIIRLSSVVPPNTTVDGTGRSPAPTGQWGDKLYCVYAERRASVAGEQAWAGIGWVQRLDGQGALFVEHDGSSQEMVVQALRLSLDELVAGRQHEFTAPDWVLSGAVCADQPVCSLVIAPYETAPWAGAR